MKAGFLNPKRTSIMSLCVFFFLIWTEVVPRWDGALASYSELNEKTDQILSKDQITEKKKVLVARKEEHSRRISVSGQAFEANQTGVIAFLDQCAKKAGLRIKSLVPAEPSSDGGIKKIGFKMMIVSRFHKIAKMLNLIESGPFTTRIVKLTLNVNSTVSGRLSADLECAAYLLDRDSR